MAKKAAPLEIEPVPDSTPVVEAEFSGTIAGEVEQVAPQVVPELDREAVFHFIETRFAFIVGADSHKERSAVAAVALTEIHRLLV